MFERLLHRDHRLDTEAHSRLAALIDDAKTTETTAVTEPSTSDLRPDFVERDLTELDPVELAREETRVDSVPDKELASPGRVGRLVERWLPACLHLKAFSGALIFAGIAAIAAVAAAIGVWLHNPVVESAPIPIMQSSAQPASSTAAPTQLVVSVVGRVEHPGLVTVPAGSRVADVLHSAGGATPGTDLSTVNLARRVSDGEQIAIGIPHAQAGAESAASDKVDLNSATLAQLQALPGVGPATAQRILQWRTSHGRFDSIEQLRQVDGVGESKFLRLKELVRT